MRLVCYLLALWKGLISMLKGQKRRYPGRKPLVEEGDLPRERDKQLEDIKFQPTRMKLVVLTKNIR